MPTSSIRWTPKCSVGNQQLDSEHQQIFAASDAISALLSEHVLTESDDFESSLTTLINEFFSVLTAHLEHEEAILEASKFPKLREHKELHRDGVAFLKTIMEDEASVATQAMRLHKFVKGWLLQHILIEDMKYARFITCP